MLGRMCNLNVGRISGTAKGGGHQWNTINYQDGKRADSYIYFNAPVEIMQVTHKWDPLLAPPNLQPDVDYEYSYSKFWRGNLARATSAEAGLQQLANELSDGKHTWFSVMTPLNEKFIPVNSERIFFCAACYNVAKKFFGVIQCKKILSQRLSSTKFFRDCVIAPQAISARNSLKNFRPQTISRPCVTIFR